jgi:hypothetical protein
VSDQSTPSPVQPEGQGGEETQQGSGLYDLESAPPEHRPFLEAELKKIEGNATKKFQEAAEYRKQWQPYEELGVTDVPPEQLQELLQLGQIAKDPEQFDNWLRYMAQERGILSQEGESPEDGAEEDDGEDIDLAEALQPLLEQMFEQRLGPLQQSLAQQQQEQAVSQANQQLDQEFEKLSQEFHLGELNGDQQHDIFALALPFAESGHEDPLRAGVERYLQITGQAQRSLVESKVDQPQAAVAGGQPNTAPEKVDGFSGAKQAALERMRAGGLR